MPDLGQSAMSVIEQARQASQDAGLGSASWPAVDAAIRVVLEHLLNEYDHGQRPVRPIIVRQLRELASRGQDA